MTAGFFDYVRSAFNARPIGMPVPPNWLGLALFGLLGFLSPGFWLLGAGLELGYLYVLSTHPRFQRIVDAERLAKSREGWQSRLQAIVGRLGDADRTRYRALEQRCLAILQQQDGINAAGQRAESESLGRLLWVYLTLLMTRQSISRVRREAESANGGSDSLAARVKRLRGQLDKEQLSEELRKSLNAQVEILQQRLEKQREAAEKIAFLDAELVRIQEQVELIREQGVLSTDPETVSQRIDQISATLGGTAQWLREQQRIYGTVEDLLSEPPPLTVPEAAPETPQAAKESQ